MKNRQNAILCAILFILPGVVIAADAIQSGKPAKMGIELSVTVVSNGNEIFDTWDRPAEEPFHIVPVRQARRGQFLSALMLFKNCAADNSGNCNAVVDIIAYDPQGKVYGEMKGAELWRQKAAPSPGFTQLSRDYMGIVIEPEDPAGTYRIVVSARDLNALTEARAETSFEVK